MTPAPVITAAGGGGWARARVIAVLGALSAFGPLSMDTYLPALPRVAADLHTPQAVAQLTMSACMIGLALGQIISGPLSDTMGRRRPLGFGVAAYVGLSLVCALAPNAAFLIVARLLQGLAGAAGLVISRAMVRDMYGSGRDSARIFSLLIMISGAAPVVAPLVGAQLLRVTSWRGVFVVLAVVGLVILFGTLTLPESLPEAGRQAGGLRATGRAFAVLGRDRGFVALTLASGLACCALFVYIAASPFVIEDTYARSPQLFSLIFAVNSAGIVLAGQVGAGVVRRAGPTALLRAGLVQQVVAALLLVGLVLAGQPPLAVLLVPLFLVVSAVGFVVPNATALALARRGVVAGAGSAIVGSFQFLAGAVVGPLSGLGGHSSLRPMGVLIAVLAVGALLAGLTAREAASSPGNAMTPTGNSANPGDASEATASCGQKLSCRDIVTMKMQFLPTREERPWPATNP